MTKLLESLWREEEGQDLVEYGLLLVLVSLELSPPWVPWRAPSAALSGTPRQISAAVNSCSRLLLAGFRTTSACAGLPRAGHDLGKTRGPGACP